MTGWTWRDWVFYRKALAIGAVVSWAMSRGPWRAELAKHRAEVDTVRRMARFNLEKRVPRAQACRPDTVLHERARRLKRDLDESGRTSP